MDNNYMLTDNYSINDLPRFSPWPARLLGLLPWEHRVKTAAEVMREYEHEKWGPLLAKVKESQEPISAEQVDQWALQDVSMRLCSIEDRFELLSAPDAHNRYIELIEEALRPFAPGVQLAELGSGYGSIIFNLAKRGVFSKTPLAAAEYSPSGIKLIKLLAHAQNLEMSVGHCDFAAPNVLSFNLANNAIVFTSYSACYVLELSVDFIKSLCAHKPRIVVHFEPCYEHNDDETIVGLMRRRYIEVNGYNRNLSTLLHQQQDEGLIRIIEEKRNVFGSNPLLAASVIAWAPR